MKGAECQETSNSIKKGRARAALLGYAGLANNNECTALISEQCWAHQRADSGRLADRAHWALDTDP